MNRCTIRVRHDKHKNTVVEYIYLHDENLSKSKGIEHMSDELAKILKKLLNFTNHSHAHLCIHVRHMSCTYVATWRCIFRSAASAAT